ncbi:MAG TPA: DUF1015 domain-containing protein [Pirellulales bacterium]|jgi:uncharacterized protein (DUF1015 family)|nr:DUF1015 domain-containing protein [Pirellulales bacterium]
MPEIQPFAGLRYDLGHVGSLSEVVCPPYDVIGPELHEQLYKRHPANMVRLELNREEPGDNDATNRYTRAARFLKNWRSEGVLVREGTPALYVYHQVFEHDGNTHTRRGFMARCRLERFGEGKIYPHEETLAGPKQDRLLLTRACRANLSQIFGLYPDAGNQAQELLETAIAGQPAVEAVDHLGVTHRMWTVTDVAVIAKVIGLMGPKPMFIADGHHRYETACNYRDELAATPHGTLDANHPANFVLMMCVAMADPGLLVLPTHRLFRGIRPMTADHLADRLGTAFTTRIAGEGADLAPAIWDELAVDADQGTLALYTGKDQHWTIATITESGRRKMAEVASDHSDDWQGLGVAILHRLVIDTLLAATDLPKPLYVHSAEEVTAALRRGDVAGRDATGVVSTGGQFELAALVMPATVDHIRSISEHAERMPAKSTYFYPKLLGGMVIYPHE